MTPRKGKEIEMSRVLMLGSHQVTHEEMLEVIRTALEERYGARNVATAIDNRIVVGDLTNERGEFYSVSVAHSYGRPPLEQEPVQPEAVQVPLF